MHQHTSEHNPKLPEELDSVLWFIYQEESLVLEIDSILKVPSLEKSCLRDDLLQRRYHILGYYAEKYCIAVEIEKSTTQSLPDGGVLISIRQAHEIINNDELFQLVLKGKQLLHWDKSSQFCGYCGERNLHHETERAKTCSFCKSMHFPQFSPAILALIWREDEILLARSPHFLPGIYSILAGFVEPGETLEQTVVRETHEEVGLTIKNCRYFGSESWPFPSNLMIGFTAEYAGGELQVNRDELEDARWFSVSALPQLPKSISLSRRMIDAYTLSRA